MSLRIAMNAAKFQEQLNAAAAKMMTATRPAAQAGAQVIYERARLNAPVSKNAHMFHIEGRKYGPFQPGNLRESIYQVFSTTRSFRDVSTYEISFNKERAPYGFTVTRGTSKTTANNFIGKAVVETRATVRNAMKERYILEVNK